MAHQFLEIAATSNVKAAQSAYGSRAAYAPLEGGETTHDRLASDELEGVLRAAVATGRLVGLEVTSFYPSMDPDGTLARAVTTCLFGGLAPPPAKRTGKGRRRRGEWGPHRRQRVPRSVGRRPRTRLAMGEAGRGAECSRRSARD